MADKKTSKTKADAEETPVDDIKEVTSTDAEPSESEDIEEQTAEAETEADSSADTEPLKLEDPITEEVEPSEPVEEETSAETVREVVKTETVVERQGAFIPLLLGGLAAGGIGFAVSHFGLGPDTSDAAKFEKRVTEQLEAQTSQISLLGEQIGAVPEPVDLSGIETGQQEIRASVEALVARIDELDGRLGELDGRLTEVEKRPLTEGASDAAVAAYERELQALQDAMAAQRAEIEAMTADAQNMEENAEATAQATMRRAALTRIQTALESGTGFAAALADLEMAGLAAPDALSAVADNGVMSLAQLQAEFPDVARAALAAARKASAEAGEGGGFAGFLKTQLGARSLEPKEGNDPDAVLSRAEAAAREGRLTDALAEIEALPEVGRAEISDWAGKVTQRLDAIAAAEALGQELN